MPRQTTHTHWAAVGKPVETTDARPRHKAWRTWLKARSVEAGLTPVEHRIVEMAVIERRVVPAMVRELNRRRADVEDAKARALNLLSQLPDFWEASRQFERDLLDCAANRDDREHRPNDLRGVTPDRSSDKFQGARIVSHGDGRLHQSVESACRLAMQAGV